MLEAGTLRELAAWYREFAKWVGDPVIQKARRRMAEDLERAADRIALEDATPTRDREESPNGDIPRHRAVA